VGARRLAGDELEDGAWESIGTKSDLIRNGGIVIEEMKARRSHQSLNPRNAFSADPTVMIVAAGHMRDFGYLARSNAIMYNMIGLMDIHQRTEEIYGLNFCAFSIYAK